jgi:integrase/recombinase XerD
MKLNRHGQAKILTGTEIDRLFSEGLESDRDRALFGTCLYTACRISEACSLLSEDVFENGQPREFITIRRSATKGKGATRQMRMHPKLKALLENHSPGREYVFPGRWRGSISPISASQIFSRACDRTGLIGVSTHSFRRTALTVMSNAGVPLRVIQEISGHKSLAVLQRYLDVNESGKDSAIAALEF